MKTIIVERNKHLKEIFKSYLEDTFDIDVMSFPTFLKYQQYLKANNENEDIIPLSFCSSLTAKSDNTINDFYNEFGEDVLNVIDNFIEISEIDKILNKQSIYKSSKEFIDKFLSTKML